jgi:type IV pilus assembly protein PilC
MAMSENVVTFWYLIPPSHLVSFCSSNWYEIQTRSHGLGHVHIENTHLRALFEKNIMARTTRTLGTLVASGVPILEGLTITRETAGNSLFERMYGQGDRRDPRR